MMWTLDDGLRLVRALQPDTQKYGYHLCLGGSVLNEGKSRNDIDLFFVRQPGVPITPSELKAWLTELWGQPQALEPLDNRDDDVDDDADDGDDYGDDDDPIPVRPAPIRWAGANFDVAAVPGIPEQPQVNPPQRGERDLWGRLRQNLQQYKPPPPPPVIAGNAVRNQFIEDMERIKVDWLGFNPLPGIPVGQEGQPEGRLYHVPPAPDQAGPRLAGVGWREERGVEEPLPILPDPVEDVDQFSLRFVRGYDVIDVFIL